MGYLYSYQNIEKQYFGMNHSVIFHQPVAQGDTLVMKYRAWSSNEEKGEFRFRWDENAQWFSVEQIVY